MCSENATRARMARLTERLEGAAKPCGRNVHVPPEGQVLSNGSKAVLAAVVLDPVIDPGMCEICNLCHQEEVVLAKRLGLLPLTFLHDLSTAVRLVILLPESVDRRVVDDASTLEPVGPDVGPDVL